MTDSRLRLKEDFEFYARNCLKIRTKEEGLLPLILNDAQLYIHNKLEEQKKKTGKVRGIVLKGRQQGVSTYVEGRFLHNTTHNKGVRAFILTHDAESTNALFEMTERYYENLPRFVKPQIGASNAKELSFGKLDSGYKIGTAGNKAVGRGQTIQYFHGSEVAFWQNASEHTKGIMQAIPNGDGTEVILESTANGVGNYFHQQWKAAEKGTSDFIPIFVPWYWQSEYRRNADDFTPDDDELKLVELYGLDVKQLSWRRMKIAELATDGEDGEISFRQEYPNNAVEAFQVTGGGQTLINSDHCMKARKATYNGNGPLIVGVDPSRGGDRFTFISRQGRKMHTQEAYTGAQCDKLGKNVALCKAKLDTVCPIAGKKPDMMFVDFGSGADIVDRLHELGYEDRVKAVHFGSTPLDPIKYKNKRNEIWGEMGYWITDESMPVDIPDSDEIQADMCASPYDRDSNDRKVLWSKDKIKKILGFSPDYGDAGALTFTEPVNTAVIEAINFSSPFGQIEMFKFTKVSTVLKQLTAVQGNEKDQRQLSRECNTFVTKVDGQWEPNIWAQWGTAQRPRYNFDRVSPIIDLIVGELEQNEFAATVSPSDEAATKDNAVILDGMVRAIQNHSGASSMYKRVARKLVTMGFDAMRVVSDWKEGDSFQQELKIEYIANAIDRVWFDPNSEKQDRSDAEWVIVLQALTKDVYDEKFPKGSGVSIDTTRDVSTYDDKRETVVVGQIYWKKHEDVTIIQLSTGEVIEGDKVPKELADMGITEVKRRKRKKTKVVTRLLDGQDFLNEEEDTVFSNLPVIPFYHCFEISEDKVIWRRIVEKLMDPQRIYNYAKSRQIEEGALAPREKIWMTRNQAKGHEGKIATMNTNADPVQFYTPDSTPGAVAPYKTAPSSVNPALATTAADAAADIEAISGMYAASLAKNPGSQSGKAIGLQMDKGDTGNVSFYADMAVGITYLCKILIDAIPIVHDTKESFNLIRPDGTREEVMINSDEVNKETFQVEKKNDLSVGKFSVICEMGTMFKNSLEKGNAALLELGGIMPGVLEASADIFVRNIPAPNMDAVADRIRTQLFTSGQIPEDQWTDEEREKMEQQQQTPPQPDPMMIAAEAELQKAHAEQGKVAVSQEKNQIEMAKLELQGQDMQQKNEVATAEAVSDIRKSQADTQKTLVEAEGVAIDNEIKMQDAASAELRQRIELMSIGELAALVG